MFTDKHVVAALLIAPVLSVLAWFAVGNLSSEQAAPAESGQSYPLIEKSTCRYPSGICELENQDVKLTLTLDASVDLALQLSASHVLTAALMSVSYPDRDPGPRVMQPADAEGMRWRLPLAAVPVLDERIRLVVSLDDSTYFADASTRFLQVED